MVKYNSREKILIKEKNWGGCKEKEGNKEWG